MTEPTGTDTLTTIAGIEPGSRQHALWHSRPDIVAATQATFEAIFDVSDDASFSGIEREAAALWSATLAGAAEVAAFHRARVLAFGDLAGPFASLGATVDDPGLDDRQRAILKHVDLLTTSPSAATAADIDAVMSDGVDAADVVVLAQLVAFVAFEIRAIAALRAIAPVEEV